MTPPRPNESAHSADFEFAALSEARNYREALVRDFSPWLQGRVLEVGAGIGQITNLLRHHPAVTKLVSVEPDAAFCARLRSALPGLTVIEGTIDDLLPGEDWNAIVSINVLEHIAEDARELGIYRRVLTRKNGALCLFVPARPEIYAPIDKDFGHFRRYTRSELQNKLERAGFAIERLWYFNCVGYFAWWLNFCLLQKRAFDLGSVRFFDRCIFPLVHALEWGLVHPPFGQSLLAVARAI